MLDEWTPRPRDVRARMLHALATADMEYSASSSPSFNVQHGFLEITADPQPDVTLTALGNVLSAFELNISNRLSTTGNAGVNRTNEQAVGYEIESTTALGVNMVDYNENNDAFTSWAVIEYIGAGGGPNEIIVRVRQAYDSSVNGDTYSFTPGGVSDAGDLFAVVPGFAATSTDPNAHFGTATVVVNSSTGEVTVERGTTNSDVSGVIPVIEATGSNWTVYRGTATSSLDEGTITLDGSVGNWANCLILHSQQNVTGGVASHDAIYSPGTANNEVDWFYSSGHAATNDHAVFVLENAGFNVTRYSLSAYNATAGEKTLDITSAGLTDLSQAMVYMSAHQAPVSGGSHYSALRTAYLKDLTTVGHRSSHSAAGDDDWYIEFQVADFSGLTE